MKTASSQQARNRKEAKTFWSASVAESRAMKENIMNGSDAVFVITW